MQPTKRVSSENVIKCTYWSSETQSFVKRLNKKSDYTHPCGAPIYIYHDWPGDKAVEADRL